MFEQIRMMLANVKSYVNAISLENELLRKEIKRLQEENSKLKENR